MKRLRAVDLARLCGVTKNTVLNWESAGKLGRWPAKRDRNNHRFWTSDQAEQIKAWAESESSGVTIQ